MKASKTGGEMLLREKCCIPLCCKEKLVQQRERDQQHRSMLGNREKRSIGRGIKEKRRNRMHCQGKKRRQEKKKKARKKGGSEGKESEKERDRLHTYRYIDGRKSGEV